MFSNKIVMVILFFCMISSKFLGANEVVPSTYEMVKIESNQILILDNGFFFIDNSNVLIPVDGFISFDNSIFAIKREFSNKKAPADCGHRFGCKYCYGCIVQGCWNYCPGCRR